MVIRIVERTTGSTLGRTTKRIVMKIATLGKDGLISTCAVESNRKCG